VTQCDVLNYRHSDKSCCTRHVPFSLRSQCGIWPAAIMSCLTELLIYTGKKPVCSTAKSVGKHTALTDILPMLLEKHLTYHLQRESEQSFQYGDHE